jgi:aromatic ring-opening dioxygenase catalytic subunit (LigB family)
MPWRYDNLRGFDHGVFIPLKVPFPRADLPIVQVLLILLNISSLPKPLRLYVTKEC